MFTEKISYTDLNGEEQTKTLYFNISKSELVKENMAVAGTLQKHLERISEAKDLPELGKAFNGFIRLAYGEIAPDGQGFIKRVPDKNAEGGQRWLFDYFEQTPAYDAFYMKLMTDNKYAAKFIQAILPKDMIDQARAQIEEIAGPGQNPFEFVQ